MMIASGWFPIWDRLVALFSTPSLQLFLVIGFAIVALAVIILAMTRWGQTRPIMKCVILSVAAHILLLGYFYGTNLIFQYPAINPGDSVAVSLIGYEVHVEEEVDNKDAANTEPWDDFVNHQPLPDNEGLARPNIESAIELERKTPEIDKLALETGKPIDSAAEKPVELPSNEREAVDTGPSLTDVPPVVIEAESIEFRRRGEGGRCTILRARVSYRSSKC